jgi:hypothetical protein
MNRMIMSIKIISEHHLSVMHLYCVHNPPTPQKKKEKKKEKELNTILP